MISVGVDPGFGGAICWLEGSTATVFDMPVVPGPKGRTQLNYWALLEILRRPAGVDEPITVWVEQVASRPGQGVSSVFRFGQQLGAIEMAAVACRHELRYVTPAVWKRAFGLSADKGVARSVAMQRFPGIADMFRLKKHDGRAEAALIALYGAEHA